MKILQLNYVSTKKPSTIFVDEIAIVMITSITLKLYDHIWSLFKQNFLGILECVILTKSTLLYINSMLSTDMNSVIHMQWCT